jgi:glutathione peroxidase
MSLYSFSVKDIKQQDVSLNAYQGKVLLIVNTATGCGFTPQYEGLEGLYRSYKDQGFEVLDFPCNQFNNQAPGSDEDLSNFCKLNYNTSFTTFAKIDVNGTNAHPLFDYLKKNTPNSGVIGRLTNNAIKWNFTKFLVDREGSIIKRYEPITTPRDLEADLIAALKQT